MQLNYRVIYFLILEPKAIVKGKGNFRQIDSTNNLDLLLLDVSCWISNCFFPSMDRYFHSSGTGTAPHWCLNR